jgi:arginyl-tRNA synthetase
MDETLEALRSIGAAYDRDGATWLRASDFGDSEDRVLVKSSGLPTYLLPDLAYHRDKHERGFDQAIDVWGADHHSYAVRMRAGLEALGYPSDWLRPVIYQQISLIEDGEEVRLSTRRNRMVTLAELLDDVGVDVTRWFLLMRKGDTHMTFDLDLARRQSDENPVYYVQYAHARICSMLEQWGGDTAALAGADASTLVSEQELALLARLMEFPEAVESAARDLSPHVVAFYLRELAASFHSYYNATRILVDEENIRNPRLALACAVRQVLRNGLALLGVSAPEKM